MQDIKSIESNLHSADGESEIPSFCIITSKDRIDFRVESYVSMAKIQFLLETAIDAKQRIRSLILSGAKGSAKVSEMQILNRKVFNAVQYSWKKCLNSVIARDTVQREYATTVHVNCAGGVNVLDGLVIVPLNDGSSEVMNESYNQNVTGPPVTDTEGTLVGSPVSMKPDQKAAMIEGTAETTNEDFKPECEEEVEVPEKDAPEDDKLEMVEVHVL